MEPTDVNDQEIDQQPQTQKAVDVGTSRRNFLKGLLALGATAVAGKVIQSNHNDDQPPPINLAESSDVQPKLYATATAVARRNESSSFVEQGDFNRELFERVRRGTFTMGVEVQKQLRTATAFFIGKENDFHYFVTAKHTFTVDNESKEFKNVSLQRSGMDETFFYPTDISASYLDQDVVLLKCSGEYPQTNTPIEKLAYIDSYKPNPGDRELVVGYPYEFEKSDPSQGYITQGSICKVDRVNLDSAWYLKGLADHGSSGSPVVIKNREGAPAIVGLVTGGNGNDEIYCSPLNISKLKSILAQQQV